MKLRPKKWEAFQHYKDRCPPWIKLHREILNDRVFMLLPTASKALAPLLWLLASESKAQDGTFDASTDELEFRLRISRKEIEFGRKALIENGFFVDASIVLAPCEQTTSTEGEEEGEEEGKTKKEGEEDSANQSRRKTRIAAEFDPRPEEKLLADDLGIEFEPQLQAFKDHHEAKGSLMADWNAALRTWLRNAKRWERSAPGTRPRVNQQEAIEAQNIAVANRFIQRMKTHEQR
jgi:hypothetical protein